MRERAERQPWDDSVRFWGRVGQIDRLLMPTWHRLRGLTLIELLCVIAIIAILAAFYLGAISKAVVHVKKVLGN